MKKDQIYKDLRPKINRPLKKEVHAANEVTRLLEKNYNYICPQLEQFVNKKIEDDQKIRSIHLENIQFLNENIQFLYENPEPCDENCTPQIEEITFQNDDTYFLEFKIECIFKFNKPYKFPKISEIREISTIFIGEIDENGKLININKNPYFFYYDVEEIIKNDNMLQKFLLHY